MADHTGQQLGNYRFVRRLGHGSFAEVCLGEHVYLKSYAALKILRTILKEDDVERFLSEAQTLVGLRHPNIVRVLEFIFEQDTPVLVMDYAPGGTARQRYPSGSRLPVATTVAYVRQVADALQYAHNHSIIHRDVKPENILFDSDQHILLSDFGLALLTPSPQLLSTQEWAGTIPYMAPEQLQGKPRFASDQYALGIVAYEWLCGVRPFEGNPLAIVTQHMYSPPPPLREKRSEIPAEVENVVLRALAKDPEQRYTSIQAFAVALARASQQHAVTPDDDTQPLAALKITSSPPSATDSTLTRYRAQTPPRIFLTAAPADESFAARLRTDLEARGVVVSSAPEASMLDQQEELRQAVCDTHMILVVISPYTRSSRTVKEQLRIAGMYQQRMVFVRAAGDEIATVLPEAWGRTAMIDLVDARGARYMIALNEIMAFLKEGMSTVSPEVPTLPLPSGEPRNPFKGLRAFTKGDAADFFGRDTLILELAETIEGMLAEEKLARPGSRLLTVIGPSGSGKSSVLMAGLLPELQKSALPGSEEWVYLEPIVPGQHPLESLVLALAPRLPNRSLRSIRMDLDDDSARGLHLLATQLIKQPDTRVVLTIDQFEELFTQTTSEQERQRFIDLLATAATEPRGPLIILLTLRADYYDRPMHYPQLSDLIEAHQTSVRPMNPHELRAIIERPAILPDVQVILEDNLVGDLLFEAQGQIGTLPLLEFTLDQLFRLREGRQLTRQAYRQIGGVKGALAKHAESTYASLPSEEQRQLARALFLRLIDPGITEQETTRRRAALSELSLPESQQTALMQEVADIFVSARLLTTGKFGGVNTIEVSHEALIREWPRLAEWLTTSRNDILLQQAISKDTEEWIQRNKPLDRLYRGAQLVEAQAWMERNTPSSDEKSFLEASAKELERQRITEQARQAHELELQHRASRRQRYVIGMMAVTTVVLVVALVVTLLLQGRLQTALTNLQNSLPVNVTNLNDHGPGSLRQAIALAENGGAITFAKNLKGTLTLTSGALIIAKNLAISGPGASNLTISAGNRSNVIEVLENHFVTLSNITITKGNGGNSQQGGAVLNNGTLVIINCVLSGNTSTDEGGGAIDNRFNARLIITSTVISGNKSTDGGGGIFNLAGDITITNSTISNNTAVGTQDGFGGGIYNEGNLTISNSTLLGNKAFIGGGGIYNNGSLTLTNSTISGNTAPDGGGLGNISPAAVGGMSLLYVTIADNTAKTGGGISTDPSAATSMMNSIVAGNHASSGPDILGPVGLLTLNLIQNTSGTIFQSSPDGSTVPITGKSPDLGPLQNNGGPTLTYALLPGSPAIDQIPTIDGPGFCGAQVSTDQRGMKRPDGNESSCDLGAYESAY